MQKIFNAQEFHMVFAQGLPIQILLLHQNESAIPKSVKRTVTKLENRYSDLDINFYSADTSSSKVRPLVNLYHLEKESALLFFKKGQLKNKIEGNFSKTNLESTLQNLLNEPT